jgi:hypothetical protein
MFPEVRLPIDNAPADYWRPEDTGHIKETEEFPFTPPDGVYIWEHSDAYSKLTAAIDGLKPLVADEDIPANPTLVAEAKEKLVKAEKDLKVSISDRNHISHLHRRFKGNVSVGNTFKKESISDRIRNFISHQRLLISHADFGHEGRC